MEIVEVNSAATYQDALIALLQDCVDSGASVGFLPPLSTEKAASYWQGVEADLRQTAEKYGLPLSSNRSWGPFSSHSAARPTVATEVKWKN